MKGLLERLFHIEEKGSTVRIELLGGMTTFMTMSYIIFVQPAILSGAGMDRGAVMTATCLSAALATVLMGFLANYPIALAPGMGLNVFFAVTVCAGMGYSWQTALGAVFISGCLFVLLSLFGIWKTLVDSVPDSLKHAIAVGIGLFITLIGLEYGGVVVASPGTFIGLGDLTSKPVALVLAGVAVTAVLMALKVRSAILAGILFTALAGIPLGIVQYGGIIAAPPSMAATFFQLDIAGALQTGLVTVVFTFFFIDLFDTMGTLIGVSSQAGLLKDGKLPRANRAMLADAVGTVSGALFGTSTVTSYIESSTGIAHGARTGLSNLSVAFFFIVALFFSPLAEMIGGEVIYNGASLKPGVAPPLIIVGFLMMRSVTRINWDDLTDSLPAFLTIAIIPMSMSITEGIAFGLISLSLLKLVTGKGRSIHWLIYLFAVLSIIRYIIR
ncbi:MAG: NCS2 family permease [Acidobacteria bacterium]|nr:NCS2 family permease [Acidobacteriota bacterium]MBU1475596.1 NCS2 family permease [Acidobacteriota bacterium]